MMFPSVMLLFIFNVVPMAGIAMAFQRYNPVAPWFGLGSKWTGLDNFRYIFFMHPTSKQVVLNTLIIATAKIIASIIIPVAFAILLNECLSRWLKRSIQTVVYLPYFLSWIVVGAMFRQIFSPLGIVNSALTVLHIIDQPVMFMASNTFFRPIIVFTDIWKNFGYSAVVYIAAITAIDISLYESADIDGADRWQKMRYITIPGILPTIILLSTLALGNILNAGFDQIYSMYNTMVYETGDVLDTFVYRIGLNDGKFHWATAMGLSQSLISMILIIISYRLADRYAGYRIF
jgi:putative aldouronate transport system permease protein